MHCCTIFGEVVSADAVDFLCTNSNSEVTAFDLIGDEKFLWYWPLLAVEQSLHVSGRIYKLQRMNS
jgi:hypothetical protein